MPFTTVKTIGSGQPFTTLQSWEDAAPVNLTTAERWPADTFVNSFVAGDTLAFAPSGAAGKFLATDGSTYLEFGITSGTPAANDVVTSTTKSATIRTAVTATGCVWQGQGNAASDTFTAACTFSGSTASSTAYKELTTKTGASYRDQAGIQSGPLRYGGLSGVTLSFGGDCLILSENFVRVSGWQVQNTYTGGYPRYCVTNSGNPGGAASANIIDNCILENNGSGAGTYTLTVTGSGTIVKNTLMVQRRGSATHMASAAYSSQFINVTAVVPSDKTACTNAFSAQSSVTFKNVAAFGCSNFSINSPTFTTCYTDDPSPPSGATTVTYANQFVTTTDAARDFRLKAGANCIDNGTTDSTNAPIDIAGTARPSGSSYDVGCWEYVASATDYPVTTTETGSGADTVSQIFAATGVVTETGTAADTPTAVTGKAAANAETATPVDTCTAIVGYSVSLTDTASPIDTIGHLLGIATAIAESGSAVDTLSNVAAFSHSVVESGSAVDTSNNSATLSGTVTETGAAADTSSNVTALSSAIAEAATAAETVSSSSAGNYIGTAAETGSAADAIEAVTARLATVTETGSAADTSTNVTSLSRSIAEAGTAVDTISVSAAGDYFGTVAESIVVIDTQSQVAAFLAALAEAASAVDTSSAPSAGNYTATVTEIGAASDLIDCINAFFKTVSESGSAQDVLYIPINYFVELLESGVITDISDALIDTGVPRLYPLAGVFMVYPLQGVPMA